MAGSLLQIRVYLTPPVTGRGTITRLRSRNRTFALLSGNHCYGSRILHNSLPPRKLHFVAGTSRTSSIIRNSKISHQENNWDPPVLPTSLLVSASTCTEAVLKFAASNFLPLALIGGVAFALGNPNPGCLAYKYQLSKFSIIGIFLISGLTLRSEEIGEAVEAWPAGLFGLASILLLTPLLSRFMVQLHLQPQEFITGLALYNCMPTAISSGVALTRLAGGNSALALALTVLSSLLGIMIVPFSISKLIASGGRASVPADQMLRSLILTLLIPLILGKAFRESFKGIADIVDSNRKLLSALGAIMLSLIPWVQVSKSRPLLLMVKPQVVLVAVIMGVLLHLVLLCFNAISIQILCAVSGGSKSMFAKKETYITLLLVASQKTVSVLVAVVDQLGGTFGEAGLLVLPCVAAHISQVIIDSLIVSFWNKRKKSLANTKTL